MVKSKLISGPSQYHYHGQVKVNIRSKSISLSGSSHCSYLMSVHMYAYEVQREDEFVNCFYPTVNKFLEKDNNDLLYCIVLYCIVLSISGSFLQTVLFFSFFFKMVGVRVWSKQQFCSSN